MALGTVGISEDTSGFANKFDIASTPRDVFGVLQKKGKSKISAIPADNCTNANLLRGPGDFATANNQSFVVVSDFSREFAMDGVVLQLVLGIFRILEETQTIRYSPRKRPEFLNLP